MASNSGNDQSKPKGTAKRGFAAMDEATQRSIASKGDRRPTRKGRPMSSTRRKPAVPARKAARR